jgi:hypothetical protein
VSDGIIYSIFVHHKNISYAALLQLPLDVIKVVLMIDDGEGEFHVAHVALVNEFEWVGSDEYVPKDITTTPNLRFSFLGGFERRTSVYSSENLGQRMSAPIFGPGLLKLNHERLQRRPTKIRFRRAHVNARGPEFPKLFIGHSPQTGADLIPVCGYFHSAVSQHNSSTAEEGRNVFARCGEGVNRKVDSA